mgnify:CR=1 FL=1
MTLKNKKNLLKKKRGAMSLPFVILIMVSLITMFSLLSEYSNMLIIRNVEAASDLAVVECLRKHVDEDSLRYEESLYIPPEEFLDIRNEYIESVRNSAMQSVFAIKRIEIPEMDNGNVVLPGGYAEDGIYKYSYNKLPDGTRFVDSSVGFTEMQHMGNERDVWYLGGDDEKYSSITIVKDRTNLQTSGIKEKESYIMTVKTTIVYNSIGLLSRMGYNFLKYNDIFNDDLPTTSIYTVQYDKGITAVTIETIGKVTLS